MPVITYEGGQLPSGKKKQLIEELTEAGQSITGVPKQYFSVLIRELPDDNLGMGGEQVAEIKRTRSVSQD